MIEIDNVTKWFSEKQVLSGITEIIPDGECFTIIGPSGQGKSTLLRIIAMLDTPSSGGVLIDGNDVSHAPLELRRKLGMVFQQPVAFKESVYDNIALGLRYRGFRKDTIQYRVSTILEQIGLLGYENRKAPTLSGGEMQRVSLARVLVTEPDILLLDEPTANLDPVSVQVIESLISSYHKTGHTVLMSTHDLYQGQRLCDRIGAMMHGTFIQTGSPKDVFTRPISVEVANFIGVSNIFDGMIKGFDDESMMIQTEFGVLKGKKTSSCSQKRRSEFHIGERGAVSVRPEEIKIYSVNEKGNIQDNVFSGLIIAVAAYGLLTNVTLDLDGATLTAQLRWSEVADLDSSSRDHVFVHIPSHAVHFMSL
ncbi:MAG: ABC transporter ATP-binding protein [Methanomicrobiales archaeon]|jgi:tungstate transport system ATP-binding protein|nr:ABC transporter ATP-binding protein [Methanomicrobiales archaeon]